VIELLSPRTRAEDKGSKRQLYDRLGALEYYLFDPHYPHEEAVEEDKATKGKRSEQAAELLRYQRPTADVPFGPVERVTSGEMLHSSLLGLGFRVEGRALLVVDEEAARVLPTPEEEEQARQAAEQQARQERAVREVAERQARQERAAREAAEVRAQALADELARLRAQRNGDQG
jgi:hypothetical protein